MNIMTFFFFCQGWFGLLKIMSGGIILSPTLANVDHITQFLF